MAQKKKTGVGGMLVSAFVIVCALSLGVWIYNANNMNSLSDFLGWAHKKSSQIDGCIAKDVIHDKDKIVCENGEAGGADGGGSVSQGNNPSPTHVDIKGIAVGSGGSSVKISDIKSDLSSLKTSAFNPDGYERKNFPHWTGSPCDTRERILQQAGQNVNVGDRCRILGGTWSDSYTGESLKAPSDVQIDFIIPLSYASGHGARDWDESKRASFANDAQNLTPVSESSKTAKGENGPSKWIPEKKESQCGYAVSWVQIAKKYSISIDEADKAKLSDVLSTCQ